ncbi:NADH-quinone oxidoreductase subunit L [Serinibacter arcticus]|uniref:NADH-ubiquinone oxidoreductase chain L n=1 Tax=Serinibacter arcticus TaxID=1655435 RepID=A0A4Z1E6T1_9MICO|nr:NADH-quinone oxidoreductase subunit L [Serinibacter arcticus]TGO06412.1 NADH-ubiquinone oxidoreductase chain L [Serinibacter arcticus]
MIDLAWLVVAIPLASSALLLLLGRRSDAWGHLLATLAAVASFVVGLLVVLEVLGQSPEERINDVHLFSWIPAGELSIDAGLRVDPLSLTFVMLITFVGSLIHVYSIGYMTHDPARRRFFAYLNLFVAAMLVLVLADSYALLFVGWEGVGLASYLLIGFWNHNTDYAVAAKKAFVMNRVGDMGLIVAMGLMFASLGTVSFSGVDAAASGLSTPMATAIGLLLLLGACGKSAQFPLQAWLGDAMAGPTPVSALIHAATMVTAGVYLIVRADSIFSAAPTAQLVTACVGAFTLLLGAAIACGKDDIKKSLAGSTMSQIGYMVLAAGLGPIGYAYAIFHLVTHGFFKAGLFLGAGSVMHANGDSTDMRTYGGLRKVMLVTWATFAVCWLAIIGVPPFAGFYSKDKIIETAFVGEGWQPWVFGGAALVGAAVTAFYMSRMFFMTFHGKARWVDEASKLGADDPRPRRHPHESPLVMTLPVVVLAIGAVSLGFLLSLGDGITGWLEPVTGHVDHPEPVLPVPVILTATLVLVAAGVALAWRQYGMNTVPLTAPAGSPLTRAARRDFFADDVNEALAMRPGQHLTRTLVYADTAVVDGAVTGAAAGTVASGRVLRKLQNGYVRSYAAMILAGVVIAGAVLHLVRL